MKNYIITAFILLLILSGCAPKPKFSMDDINSQNDSDIIKQAEDIITDEHGKEFYKEKIEPHYAKFRWIKNRKVPVYGDASKFSSPVTYAYSREFVEIVEGRLGLELSRIRVFNKERGYIEGYTKNKFLFETDYYSEPYELTEMEIMRRKEEAEKKKKREEERLKKNLEMQRNKEYNLALASARSDSRSVMKMTFQQLSQYLSSDYKEDQIYTQNATKTVKFANKDVSVYFTMLDGQVVGFHAVHNGDGFSKEEANVFLFEFIGELFYNVDEVENINKYIIKKFGTFEKSEYPMIIKFDNSKENPIIEITVGDFSGIE